METATQTLAATELERITSDEGYQDCRKDLKVAAALMRAQAKFPPILKDTNNPFYKSKYATLDQVMEATQPALREEDLVIVQKNIQEGDRHGIYTRLLHVESGEELTSCLLARPKEDTIQQIAGVLTYCRRYEYHTITGTASEDDDGAAASGAESERSYSERPQPRPTYTATTSTRVPTRPSVSSSTTVNTPPATFAGDSSPSKHPDVPSVVPKTALSEATALAAITSNDIRSLPTKDEYDAYIAKAIELTAELEKQGLKAGRGLPAKTKLKRYIFHAAKVEKLEDLKTGQWNIIFDEFSKLLATDPKRAVELVEAANPAKETA